ncbi:MAG: hypothetical protein GTN99_00435, partial [Candidatus Dadabacteria bacterium]|nr:hypothetical protein [Candidatus Dadabacteria bacterium]
MKNAAKVAFPIPKSEYYYYKTPRSLKSTLKLGHRVLVPIGKRKSIGYVIGFGTPPEDIKLKEILDVLDEYPLFDKKRMSFFKWVSDYYMAPIGLILKAAHPGGLGLNLNKVVKITGHGKALLGSGTLDIVQLQILKALSESSLTISKLLELIEGTTNTVLNKLISRNLV